MNSIKEKDYAEKFNHMKTTQALTAAVITSSGLLLFGVLLVAANLPASITAVGPIVYSGS